MIELDTDTDYSRRQRFHALTTSSGAVLLQVKRLKDVFSYCREHGIKSLLHRSSGAVLTLEFSPATVKKE